jgi:hypothetical protein
MLKLKFSILFILFSFIIPPLFLKASDYSQELSGRILIQTEENGEAWYIYPSDGKRYYLGRPDDAFSIMQKLSLGASHDFINQRIFPKRLAGIILLDVEAHGEAYYIHPESLEKHYLCRPVDAFAIMKNFGLGVKNEILDYIMIGNLESDPLERNINQSSYIENVPFTPQAPFADWNDQRQQDGCEEASALMAIKWTRNENLSREEALSEITGVSDYLLKKYGEYRDISSKDVVSWIFKDYFNYNKAIVRYGISPEDIIYELSKGNLIITAMNGQIMNNPYFTSPGPSRHMVVIRGYDIDRDIFITNDPGTRFGKNYEYSTEILFSAIRDYSTGYHEPVSGLGKNMIVIWK